MRCLALFLLFLLLSGCSQKQETEYCIAEIEGEGKTLKLLAEIADTDAKRALGLMGRESLCENCSMLFVFGEEGEYSFWMKNTLIPLDIIFVSADGGVAGIANAVPCTAEPCLLYPSKEKIKYALEVNGGWSEKNGIREGGFFYKGCKDYVLR